MAALQKATSCETCKMSISYSLRDGKWIHDDEDVVAEVRPHDARPELRFVVDQDCQSCGFPELGFTPKRNRRVCNWCGHEERPSTEADGPQWVTA